MTTRTTTPHGNAWCRHRRRSRRCEACRWPYPPGTPRHLQTARMATYSLWTLGLFVPVWIGYWISHRYGLAGKWIYVGAWTIAGVIALINPPNPVPVPRSPAPAVVVTVTLTPTPEG